MEDRKDNFSKLEQFLLRLALLVLLAISLLKVIAPEVRSLGIYLITGQESTATERRTEQTPTHTDAAIDRLPKP